MDAGQAIQIGLFTSRSESIFSKFVTGSFIVITSRALFGPDQALKNLSSSQASYNMWEPRSTRARTKEMFEPFRAFNQGMGEGVATTIYNTIGFGRSSGAGNRRQVTGDGQRATGDRWWAMGDDHHSFRDKIGFGRNGDRKRPFGHHSFRYKIVFGRRIGNGR